MNEATDQISKLHSQIIELESSLDALRRQNAFLETQLQASESLHVQIFSLESKLQKQTVDFQLKIAEKDEKIALLQLQHKQRSRSPKTSEFVEEDKNHLDLIHSEKNAREQVKNVQKYVAQLEKQIQDRVADNDPDHKKEYESKILAIEAERDSLKEELDAWKADSQQKDSEIEILQNQLDNCIVQDSEDWKSICTKKDAEIMDLKAQVEQFMSISELHSKNDQEFVKELKDLLEVRNKEVDVLRQEASRLESENLKFRETQVTEFSVDGFFDSKDTKCDVKYSDTEEEYEETIWVSADEGDKKSTDSTTVSSKQPTFDETKENTLSLKSETKEQPEEPSHGTKTFDDLEEKPPSNPFARFWWHMKKAANLKRADLSQDTSFTYDPVLKKWIDSKKPLSETKKVTLPPPITHVEPGNRVEPESQLHSIQESISLKKLGTSPPAQGNRFARAPTKRPQYALGGEKLGFGVESSTGTSSFSRPKPRPRPVPTLEEDQATTVASKQLDMGESSIDSFTSNVNEELNQSQAKPKVKKIIKKKRTIQRPSKKATKSFNNVSSKIGTSALPPRFPSSEVIQNLNALENLLKLVDHNHSQVFQRHSHPSSEFSFDLKISKFFM